jgi:hypothetical protein
MNTFLPYARRSFRSVRHVKLANEERVSRNCSRSFRRGWFERLRFTKRSTLPWSQEERWVVVGLGWAHLTGWSIVGIAHCLRTTSFPRVNDKREGGIFHHQTVSHVGHRSSLLAHRLVALFRCLSFPSCSCDYRESVIFPPGSYCTRIASRPSLFDLTRFRDSCLTGILRGQQFRYPSPVL